MTTGDRPLHLPDPDGEPVGEHGMASTALPSGESHAPELFGTALVVSAEQRPRSGVGLSASVIAHVFIIGAVLLVPILFPGAPPPTDYVSVLLYNPPPPPPPPLPKGSALEQKPEQAKPVTPDPNPVKPDPDRLEAPIEKPIEPESKPPETEQAGSVNGSDAGVLDGMEEGVEGGQVGGIPGGVLGGVLGGTGDIPVLDYDQPPKAIKITRPQYPQEAFIKKIEGTVEVEILIDATGRVVRARVVRSVPLLDAAALQTVYQWVFSPAIKNGRPVSTVARAPVGFRIF